MVPFDHLLRPVGLGISSIMRCSQTSPVLRAFVSHPVHHLDVLCVNFVWHVYWVLTFFPLRPSLACSRKGFSSYRRSRL